MTAWSTYVRGHIVSRHAERIIKQFMAACCTKSHREQGNVGAHRREPDDEERATKNDMSLREIRGLIENMSAQEKDVGEGEHVTRSKTMLQSIHLGTTVWLIENATWPDENR